MGNLLAVVLVAMTIRGVGAAPAAGAASLPAIFWYSDPVKPGEIALLQGDQIAGDCRVDVCALHSTTSASMKRSEE